MSVIQSNLFSTMRIWFLKQEKYMKQHLKESENNKTGWTYSSVAAEKEE